MKRIIIVGTLLFSFVTPIVAQNQTTQFRTATGYENLTVDTTVGGVSFDTTKRQFAQLVVITVSCASGTSCPIRVITDLNTTVSSSVGLTFDYGMSFSIYANVNIIRFRAIRSGSTSAVLNVQYYQ